MIKFVIRNTHTTKTAVHAHQVYGFDLVCKYWDYREEQNFKIYSLSVLVQVGHSSFPGEWSF